MNKINFENLPSTNTPINAQNLNAIQNNAETEINKLRNALINNKGTLTGTNLTANDSADNKIDKFDIKGNSIQNGTPSPSNKVEIQSAGDSNSINIEICAKNIFNKNNANIINGYIDTTHSSITSSSSARSIYIPCKPNTTYTIQKLASPNARAIAYTTELPVIGTETYGFVNIAANETSGAITTGNDAKFLIIRLWTSTQDTTVTLEEMLASVQIEENPTKTTYKNYQGQSFLVTTQQPFRKIDNLADEFIRQNGKWYEKHYIGEIVLNGSEDYSWASSLKENTLLRNLNIKSNDIQETGYILCDYYVERGNSDAVNYDYAISRYGATSTYNYEKLVFRNKDMTSANDFKTWLSTHNVTVDYILETPTLIECTQEQTIQLNEIASLARTYSPTTHIFSNDEASPNMEVTYFKDASSLLA